MKRREDKRRWTDARNEGKHDEAVMLFLVETFGADWGKWTPTGTLARRMMLDARVLCEREGFDPALADRLGQPVQCAARYIDGIIDYLGHYHFGRPPDTWRENMETYYVGREEALSQIAALKATREAGARATNRARKERMFADALRAQEYKAQGWPVSLIAETMDTAPATVYRWLALDLSGVEDAPADP